MSEELRINLPYTTKTQGTIVPACSPKSKFGRVARVLWPRKTAAELAFRAQVTERAAKFWLSGDRTPSATAVLVVVNEMLSDL